MNQELIEAMVEMREKETINLTNKLLEQGVEPMKLLDSCSKAMEIIGKRFEEGEYFLPHLMMAGEMLKQVSGLIKPKMQDEASSSKKLGRVLIGTVEGDLHDIGKDIVVFMLEVNGFEVKDLGIDVAVDKFVEEVQEFQPQVVGLSGFLTLAFDSMKNTVEAIERAGFRDTIKIMIGGGQVDEGVKNYTGADDFGTNAMDAVNLSKMWIGGI